MHSHLIPGIDDGAKTVKEAVHLVKRMSELGFNKLITTPHIFQDYYPNTPENIIAGLNELNLALTKANVDMEIEAAAEYFMDDFFEEKLNQDAPLLTFGQRHILVEVSTMAESNNLLDLLFTLQTKGYQPILAHPERYIYYQDRFDIFKKMRDAGCSFQVNLLSLAGHYGSAQRKLGVKLIKAGLVHYLGTDLHRERHLEKIIQAYHDKQINKLMKATKFRNGDL